MEQKIAKTKKIIGKRNPIQQWNFDKEMIEEMIDRNSLVSFLNMVDDVCTEKAEHILTHWYQWQSDKETERLAEEWCKIGGAIQNVAVRAAKRGCFGVE